MRGGREVFIQLCFFLRLSVHKYQVLDIIAALLFNAWISASLRIRPQEAPDHHVAAAADLAKWAAKKKKKRSKRLSSSFCSTCGIQAGSFPCFPLFDEPPADAKHGKCITAAGRAPDGRFLGGAKIPDCHRLTEKQTKCVATWGPPPAIFRHLNSPPAVSSSQLTECVRPNSLHRPHPSSTHPTFFPPLRPPPLHHPV